MIAENSNAVPHIIKHTEQCKVDMFIELFHIVTSLSNRSSIEKSTKLKMKGLIGY